MQNYVIFVNRVMTPTLTQVCNLQPKTEILKQNKRKKNLMQSLYQQI